MSITSKSALLLQQMINAKCAVKQTGSVYSKQKARIAELEYEKINPYNKINKKQ